MSKKKFRLKRKVWIEADMMESDAFKTLSGKTSWVLLRFLQKRTWTDVRKGRNKKRVYNDSGLSFTYTEAEYFGVSSGHFYKILKTLVERGFLDVEHRGGGLGRDYSRYRISERWKRYGKPNFEERSLERVLPRGHDIHSRKLAKNSKGPPCLSCEYMKGRPGGEDRNCQLWVEAGAKPENFRCPKV